jgi:predicted kinase
MRGIPGSGKSGLAELLAGARKAIASADHYFDMKGKFAPAELGIAHKFCQDQFMKFIATGEPMIVVDNTNIKRRDFEFYTTTAKDNGYAVVTVIAEEMDPKVCFARNQHAVPLATIERMAATFER